MVGCRQGLREGIQTVGIWKDGQERVNKTEEGGRGLPEMGDDFQRLQTQSE